MFVTISSSAKSNSVTGKLLLNWISGTTPVAVFLAQNTGKEVKT